MASTSAAYADLTRLVQDLRNASRRSQKASEEILDDVADKVRVLMVQFAPKRTGRLSQSIRVIKTNGRREIGAQGVPYDVYQEFGTATRGEFKTQAYVIEPRDANGRLTFKIGDKWISTKRVVHPGIPPHPFARPAAKQALEGIAQRYTTMGVDLIMKGNYGA